MNTVAIRAFGITTAIALTVGLNSYAANRKTADPDPWMTDRYEIEIIVFRHRDQSRNTPEQPAPGKIDYPGLSIFTLETDTPADPYVGPYTGTSAQDGQKDDRVIKPTVGFYLLDLQPRFPDFVRLADNQLQLNAVVKRLTTLDAYEPLIHQAWVQAAQPADATRPLQINSHATGDYVVAGTIKLYKERYTHLAIDLDLRRAQPDDKAARSGTDSWPVFGDTASSREPDPAPLRSDYGPTFKLQESRRIRGSDAQYFDNPQFGVIARISSVSLEED